MSSSQHSTRLTFAFASSLVLFVSTGVRAEDPASEPRAPPNVPTAGDQIAEDAHAPEFAEPASSTASSGAEPTFEAETRKVTWPNVPLLATGAAVFGGAYLPAVVGGAVSNAHDNDLYIPVGGPWMLLARGPEEPRWQKTLLAIDGVAQGLGALMLLTSFMIPERVTEHWYLIGSNDLRLVPSRIGTGYGMGASGRF